MGVLCRLGGSAMAIGGLVWFVVMGTDESLVINFRYAVVPAFGLAVWYIGHISEAKSALEKGLNTDDWSEDDD